MKKIKQAINYLNKVYKIGIIAYPRVENNYIKDKPFQFYPHPPLFKFGKNFTAIEKEETKLDSKYKALLFLNHKRILSPANITFISKTINEYLNDNLEIKKDKKEELLKIFECLKEFLEEENLRIKDIITLYTSIYYNSFRLKKHLFFLNKGYFFTMDFIISRLRAINKIVLNNDYLKFQNADNLTEAINQFLQEKHKLKRKIK